MSLMRPYDDHDPELLLSVGVDQTNHAVSDKRAAGKHVWVVERVVCPQMPTLHDEDGLVGILSKPMCGFLNIFF